LSGAAFLELATSIALVLMTGAVVLAVVRLILGPTLADRILSLDLITTLAVGYIAVIAVRTGFMLYIDIGISIALVGFLSTVALARYLLQRAEARSRGSRELIE
jgi:multicomponent Na+:H+ antiporter subunit F